MIHSDDDGPVRVVTLSRPERRNALTPEGLDELEAAVTDADTPVVYLRGEGSAFCAGADLDVVRDLDVAGARAFAERGQRVARAIESVESVVVAGIDGPARGGGVELALACDLRVATPDATFAETGVALGLFGAWGGTARLPSIVGLGEAMDLALSGRTLDAEAALRTGLVSRIVERPREVAGGIASHPPDALAVIKERLRDRRAVDRQEAAEAEAFGRLVAARRDRLE